MKINNEIKVGIITLVTIAASIYTFSFLKGKNIFKNTVNYYAVYENVGGLAKSSPVEVNGFQVGIVQDIFFMEDQSGKLVVVMSVDKKFLIPLNTVAEIRPVSIIAGMKVQLIYGNGPGFYNAKDTLSGNLNASIITTLENDIDPILNNATSVIENLDSVVHAISILLSSDFITDLNKIAGNLESSSTILNTVIEQKEERVDSIINNLDNFSYMLSANSEKISDILSNIESISDTIAISDLSSTLNEFRYSLENTSILLDNLNSGKGSAGQLLANEDLYMNLDSTLTSLNKLIKDLNSNPKKYVHFSLFGKKQ